MVSHSTLFCSRNDKKPICKKTGSGNLATLCLRPTLLYGELDPYYVTHALKIAKDHGGCLYRIGWGGERNQVTYAGLLKIII